MSAKDFTHDEAVDNEPLPERKNRAGIHLVLLSMFVAGMLGFAYLNAEYFVIFCQRIGIISGDASSNRTGEGGAVLAAGAPLEVYFSAYVQDDLPIAFTVENAYQRTNVNAGKVNNYRFTNLSDETVYFKPVHDVYPTSAGSSDVLQLRKCFCFDLQKLDPGQSYVLPVDYLFTDALDGNVRTLKMSYSLFKSNQAAYEESLKNEEAEK